MRDRIESVFERISRALSRCGRAGDNVTVIAVSKGVTRGRIISARQAGITHFGENRVQEAVSKISEISAECTWHMVGHLQRNKVKEALVLFDVIQSLDSERLALEISKRALNLGKIAKVLVQVDTTCEDTKYGVRSEDVPALLELIEGLEGIRVEGLMTIGPFTDDHRRIRDSFRSLKNLFDESGRGDYLNVTMKHLSMGMSDDFEIALEEGANMVRIGRAIFGPRT